MPTKRFRRSARSTRSRSKRRVTKRARSKSRRRTTKRAMMPKAQKSAMQLGENSVAKQLAVLRNPFSQATNQPKVPDGKSQTSLSRRMRLTQEILSHDNEAIHILLLPLLNCPATAFNVEYNGTTKFIPMVFKGGKLGYSTASRTGLAAANSQFDRDTVYWQFSNADISKWRIVSQGIRFNLLNVMDENDGWFEAIRFNWRENPSDFLIRQEDPDFSGSNWTDNGTGINSLQNAGGLGWTLVPKPDGIGSYLATLNMVTQPGYESGLLRDIHKKQFVLAPHGVDSEFNIMRNTAHLQVGPTDGQVRDALESTPSLHQDRGLPLSSNNPKVTEIIDSFIDQSFDAVYIRIHPRAKASGGSKLLCHVTQNLELCYPPNTVLAEYQTTNYRFPRIDTVMDRMNNNYAPTQNIGK